MAQLYLIALLALSIISIALSILILFRIKNVTYLLEQPIIKKMSPQLKLKPVKIEDSEEDGKRVNNRGNQSLQPNRNGRSAGHERVEQSSDRSRESREGQGRNDRTPRHERERAEGGPDRGPRGDRDNKDRFRDRNARNDNRNDGRNENRDGRNRGPRFENSNNDRDNGHREAPAPFQSAVQPVSESSSAPLAPRRPLPSTVSRNEERDTNGVVASQGPSGFDTSAEPAFNSDVEIQHGRRNQLKKKPKFNDVDDVEMKTEAAEETKA